MRLLTALAFFIILPIGHHAPHTQHRFPLEVKAGQGGVICVDWTVGKMRYQADRVFDALDGTVRRLEVTEIGTQDAENFLPMEKF